MPSVAGSTARTSAPAAMPNSSHDGHASCAKAVRNATGRHAGQSRDERADRHDDANHRRIEPERTREIERSDHQRRHHHRRDQCAHGEARTQRSIAENRQADQRRGCSRLGEGEEADSDCGSQQQSHVARAETAAPHRHGERIRRERQSQQQRSQHCRNRSAPSSAPGDQRAGSDARAEKPECPAAP